MSSSEDNEQHDKHENDRYGHSGYDDEDWRVCGRARVAESHDKMVSGVVLDVFDDDNDVGKGLQGGVQGLLIY